MHYRVSGSLDPVLRKVGSAAIDALLATPTTNQDRKQFERAFGQLYVLDAPVAARAVRRAPEEVLVLIEPAGSVPVTSRCSRT